MVTDRDIAILEAIDKYYVLNRKQIQALVFPDHKEPRVARRRLQFLVQARLLNRQNVQTFYVNDPAPSCVYFPSVGGCEFLVDYHKNEKYRLTSTRAPVAHHVQHWLEVSATHMCFDAAAKLDKEIQIDGWLNEWDVANKDEADREKHYRLYTLIRKSPKLVCVPDAALLLSLKGHKKVHYIEEDRGTSGPEQVAAQKCQGYAAMAEGKLHRLHFPETTLPSFSVLMVTTTVNRRESLRKAMKEKPGADLWRFITADDLQPAKLFTDPVFYPCEGDPRPLVKQREPADAK
jgi:hypothetical protein